MSEVTESLIFGNVDFQKLFINSLFPTKRLQIELTKSILDMQWRTVRALILTGHKDPA
jgi:hypothetical protein